MIMKKLLSIVFIMFTITLLSGCGVEKQSASLMEKILKNDKLVVGVKFDAKPFGYKDSDGKLKGFDIDLAKKIAKNILGDENKIEFVQVTPSSRILTLTSGKVDMIVATMSITPQRKHVVNFSTPYYVAGQALMTPIKSDIQGLTDLKDKKVIVVLGSTAERNIKHYSPRAIVQGYKSTSEAYNALKMGYGDAFTTDDTILAGIVMDDPTMKILSKRYTQEPYAIAFRMEEESDSLRRNVNHIIEHMRDSGELNRLKNKWLPFD